MAKCNWCNKGGILTFLDKNGLCRSCSYIINSEAQIRKRIICESNLIIEKTKNINTALSRYEVIINNIEYFKTHENRGIYVFNETIPEFLKMIYNDKNEKILKLLTFEANKINDKFNYLKTDKAKNNAKHKLNTLIIQTKIELEKKADNYKNIEKKIDLLVLE